MLNKNINKGKSIYYYNSKKLDMISTQQGLVFSIKHICTKLPWKSKEIQHQQEL